MCWRMNEFARPKPRSDLHRELCPELSVENLGRDYGRGPVLADLSFSLGRGETLAVIGPSGCGKSTLLRLLAGLDKPDQGAVRVSEGARSAFILQDYGLFPWKTAEENVALPLLLHGKPPDVRQRATAAMLAELGLGGLEKRYPSALSGGQRQRVAIGRALITGPDILLMDEPFSSLDALTREHLQAVVLEMWQRRRLTCVLVTHSVAEAVFLGRHILVLGAEDAGPARNRLWLDNPCFGDAACRTRPEYTEIMARIYAALERMRPDAAAGRDRA